MPPQFEKAFEKAPRLYVTADLGDGHTFHLDESQTHYVRNVMRIKDGGALRVFNGRDGEFGAELISISKKSVETRCIQKLQQQPATTPRIHLLFAPLKKHRMDQVIEKTVELGVTDLHPVITAHTEVREINEDRLRAQMIEAAEQSGRLELPTLYPPQNLKTKIAGWDPALPLFWGAETKKDEAQTLSQASRAAAFLVGPVGGFSPEECDFLTRQDFVKPVSLGPRVLRAETACIYCLVLANP